MAAAQRGKMTQPSNDRGFYSKYFREIDVLHGLQSKPSDREWLLSVPKGEVKPAGRSSTRPAGMNRR